MKKGFVKEIFILILLLILIMLILAVSLYDFIPANINVPEAINYSSDTITTSIKQEIAYTNGGDATANNTPSDAELVTSLKSYSVEASDLTMYGQKNMYNSGNSNPFDYAQDTSADESNSSTNNNTTTQGNGTTQTNNGNSSATTTTQTGTTTNNSNTGTFFESSTSK